MKTFIALPLGVLVFVMCAAFANSEDGDLRVVIPANKEPSRPAHFNWVFKSANGKEVRMGQFACGSWWVAPAEGDTGVTLVSLGGKNADDMLSLDDNPVTEKHGLLNGKKKYGSHDASQNLLPKLPLTFTPSDDSCVSLVAAMQRNEEKTGKAGTGAILGEAADAYCVVTVLSSAPENGGKDSIRPNITGAHKEFLTWKDFDLGRLPEVDFLDPMGEKEIDKVAMRWRNSIEILGMGVEVPDRKGRMKVRKFSEGGRAFRAHLLISNYGSGMAQTFNSDLLAFLSTKTDRKKAMKALAAMLAFGLDIYHARYDYGKTARKSWTSGAGQSMGAFLPAVLVAALQRDTEKANRIRRNAMTNFGSDPAELGPQEIRQIHRGVTGVLLWGDGHPIIRDGNKLTSKDWRYWCDMKTSSCYDGAVKKGNHRNGSKTAADPYGYIDGPANTPGVAYMMVSMGVFRSFAAIMILVPAIGDVVNTDAPIEYVDRFTRHGVWTWPDPVAIPSETDQTNGSSVWMKPKGTVDWRKSWGPRKDDARFAIEDGKGRFKSINGKKTKEGYANWEIVKKWPQIIALYDGERYEDNAVGLGEVVRPEIFLIPGDKVETHMTCATPDAKIHYTLDGSEPSAASTVYSGKTLKVEPGVVIKAIAVLAGGKTSSIRQKQTPSAQ